MAAHVDGLFSGFGFDLIMSQPNNSGDSCKSAYLQHLDRYHWHHFAHEQVWMVAVDWQGDRNKTMLQLTEFHTTSISIFVAALGLLAEMAQSAAPSGPTALPLDKARICITGYDHNRPDSFPGMGDFIGWVGDVVRLANGELLFVHSAGYWHVSFATPVVLRDNLVEPYKKSGLDLNHQAPTGGRIMACRSTDNGKSWTEARYRL